MLRTAAKALKSRRSKVGACERVMKERRSPASPYTCARCRGQTSSPAPFWVQVSQAGVAEVNGRYHPAGERAGAALFEHERGASFEIFKMLIHGSPGSAAAPPGHRRRRSSQRALLALDDGSGSNSNGTNGATADDDTIDVAAGGSDSVPRPTTPPAAAAGASKPASSPPPSPSTGSLERAWCIGNPSTRVRVTTNLHRWASSLMEHAQRDQPSPLVAHTTTHTHTVCRLSTTFAPANHSSLHLKAGLCLHPLGLASRQHPLYKCGNDRASPAATFPMAAPVAMAPVPLPLPRCQSNSALLAPQLMMPRPSQLRPQTGLEVEQVVVLAQVWA